MKKIFVHASRLNCIRRLMDMKKISNYLMLNNYALVDKLEDADSVIVSTCGVTSVSEDSAIRDISEFKSQGKHVIVYGCLPAINIEAIRKVHDGAVIATKDIEKIEEVFPPQSVRFHDIDDHLCYNGKQDSEKKPLLEHVKYLTWRSKGLKTFEMRNLYNLRIHGMKWKKHNMDDCFTVRTSWGCLGDCSFCAIKFAIGRIKSKPLEQISKEFEIGLKKGYKAFGIQADDLGAYGIDINKKFPELLKKLVGFDGEYSLYLHNIDPKWLVIYQKELVKLFKSKHIFEVNVALQSGSSRILGKMRRFNNIDKIKKVLLKLKRANEKIAFTFQTIVGFPGETDEDFADTVKFLKDMGPDNYITIGAYSDRPNTEASRMAEKVSLKEMSNRVNYMLKILKDNAIDYSEINHVGFLNRYQHPIDKNILTLPESEHVN